VDADVNEKRLDAASLRAQQFVGESQALGQGAGLRPQADTCLSLTRVCQVTILGTQSWRGLDGRCCAYGFGRGRKSQYGCCGMPPEGDARSDQLRTYRGEHARGAAKMTAAGKTC
jgi:hypothetical protein